MNLSAVIDSVEKQLERDRKLLREALDSDPNPPGLVRPDDATFMQWVMKMREMFPPEQIVTPAGNVVVESPWILMLALPNVAGGMDILRRIREIERKAVM